MRLKKYLEGHIQIWHRREHYRYQARIVKAILRALIDSKQGITVEIPVELPRQSGKTTSIVDIVESLLVMHLGLFKRPISIGIFAPQREQATTDFDRLKYQFGELQPLGFTTKAEVQYEKKNAIGFPQKWNSKTVRLYSSKGYHGEVYIFPISKTSNPESKTLDLIIIEEAQDVNDEKMKKSVFPMGAATNAPRIYVGTSGTRLCFFKRQIDKNPRLIKISLEEVFHDRRVMYKKTNDPLHMQYESFITHEIDFHGKDSDYIQTQYFGKWIIGSGQFMTAEELKAMIQRGRGFIEKTSKPVYVGIDTAKIVDRTVVTVITDRDDDERKSDLCGWLTLQGDNYEDQFEAITDWLSNFEDVRMIAIDATGQGDFMPDKFDRHTGYHVNRVKFTLEMKDTIYKVLMQVVREKLTTLPDAEDDEDMRRFMDECINLEREYKGRYLSVHHPDAPNAHDDYPDSWALAEFAKNEMIKNEPAIRSL